MIGSERLNIIFKSKRGEGYIDVIVIMLSAMMVIALAVKVFPVFIQKYKLDYFANELCRTAEVSGQVGSETVTREAELKYQTGLNPSVLWSGKFISGSKRIQINNSITVTLKQTMNIGLFGSFGWVPVELSAKATGRSEVYWKQGY